MKVSQFPSWLVSLTFAACSGGAPAVPGVDARSDAPDAPGDGGTDGPGEDGSSDADGPADGPGRSLLRLDWRAQRGPALATRSTDTDASDDLFAVTSDGFVVRTGCDGTTGACTYRWRTRDGALGREGRGWRPLYATTPVSPDGAALLVQERSGDSTCDDADGPAPRLEGDVLLVDVESGQTRTTIPGYVGHPWGDAHFTSAGGWFRLLPIDGGVCGSSAEQLRRVQAPYDVAPAFQPGLNEHDELPDGRWIASRNGDLGFVDPDAPGSFDVVTPEVDVLVNGGRWLHGFTHYPVREVLSADAAGGRHRWTLSPDEEWYALAAWGRWVMLYSRLDGTTMLRPYRVHDMAGVYADVDLALHNVRTGEGLALLGLSDVLLVSLADEQGAEGVTRVDLRTGARDRIADHLMQIVPLGDGEAAVVHDADRALLVERGPVEELARGGVVAVYAMGAPGSTLTLPQRDLAIIVRSPATGQFSLDALNLHTRRLVTLTDRLYWAPELAAGVAQETCGHPWVTRSAGSGRHTTITPSRTLHFVEQPEAVGEAALLVAPLDLSTPPRQLTTMVPAYCHAPLQSADGRLLGALIDGFDTQPRRFIRSALAAP